MALLVAVVCMVGACDDDPNSPDVTALVATSATPAVIERQGAISVAFAEAIRQATALDPENFVVINTCSGLRVPGALQLSENGRTLVFNPSVALPFLTPIAIRVQNILSVTGRALEEPFTFSATTEEPPVRDISWELLNSPTNIRMTGVSFVTRELGYLVTEAGEVYRTTDSGRNFLPRFKDINLTLFNNIRGFGPDTAFVIGNYKVGGQNRWALLRTLNGAQSFDTIPPDVSTFLLQLSMERNAAGAPQGVFGGNSGSAQAFRYTPGIPPDRGSVTQATVPIGASFFTGIGVSKDASHAAMTAVLFSPLRPGAFYSTDGGLTYSAASLPPNTDLLFGVGFVDNNTALLLGDSSTILRLDARTGVATALGPGAGIPPTTIDAETNTTTTYVFRRADFVKGSPVGWVVGSVTRHRPPEPDLVTGVILMTTDGGNTFTQQVISGAPDNGQGFPEVDDIYALAPDFAALSGQRGLVAARKSNPTETTPQSCVFNP
jgi:photosystem II stability/assembly factor-like uncharacterized protein